MACISIENSLNKHRLHQTCESETNLLKCFHLLTVSPFQRCMADASIGAFETIFNNIVTMKQYSIITEILYTEYNEKTYRLR